MSDKGLKVVKLCEGFFRQLELAEDEPLANHHQHSMY